MDQPQAAGRRIVGLALVLLGGVAFLAGAAAHALAGWPSFATTLTARGIDRETYAGLAVGWNFGTSAMATYGLLVLGAWNRLRRGGDGPAQLITAIGASYFLFGAAALGYRFPQLHFAAFMVQGTLLVAGAWLARPDSTA